MDHRFDESYPFVYIGHVWAIDHHAPLKRVNLKSNRLPWINPAIQKQMLIRNLLYKKFRRIPTNENWNRYRCQRNKVTALKKQSVKDFCFDAASVSSSCSPGLFWKKLRPVLPNSKSSIDTSSICLLENGRIVPDTNTSLNEYFTSPTINESVLTFSVDELSSHASVVDIKTKAPRINFYFHSNSGKNWGQSYQIASPVSIQVQFVYLKTAELFPTLIRLLMNILRLQQLMSLS